MLVDLTSVRKDRAKVKQRLGWTEDELALRRKCGLDGPPGTFDATCHLADFMGGTPTRAAALELLKRERRRCEEFVADMSREYDVAGWRILASEPEVTDVIELAER